MFIEVFFNFDSQFNYLFDPNKIEVVTSVSRLLAQVVGAEAALYCKLDENQGLVALDSSGNNRHGAFQGGYTEDDWTTGKINSAVEGIGLTNGIINFDQLIEFERTESFSLECWLKFTSVSSQAIISKQKDSGIFEGIGLNLAAGKIRIVVRDLSGNILTVETNSTYNDGAFHHIVATYDGSSEVSGLNIYVDNVLDRNVISSITLTNTVKNDADFQISGRDGNNITIDVGTVVDEVLVYARELTPAEISFRWNNGNGTQQIPGPTTAFPTDNPTIKSVKTLEVTSLNDFDAIISKTGNDDVKFVLEINGQAIYWNGSAWINSDGTYSQTSSLSEIKTNLESLAIIGRTLIRPVAYFHSDDGATTPELSEVSLSFNFILSEPVLNENTIDGWLFDIDGVADVRLITVRTANFTYGTEVILTSDFIDVTLESNGFFNVKIFTEVKNPDVLIWRFGNKIIRTDFLTGVNNFNALTILSST